MLIIGEHDKMLRDLRNSKGSRQLSAVWMESWSVVWINIWNLCLHTAHQCTWTRYEIQQCQIFIPPAAHTSCTDNHHLL